MKMLLVIYSGSDPQLVPSRFDRHHAGYTELCRAHGAGQTGRYEGTRAWPGDESLYFSVLPETQAGNVVSELKQLASELEMPERLHCAVLNTETFF